MNRNVDDVVQALRRAKDKGTGATLLIGAGCSVKAGIPLAGGFVDEIGRSFPLEFARAKGKTYAHCMRELLYGDRRDLIAGYVDNAKINWAHVCIAALMKAGYVDRVLTTNFDNLVVRACALLGEFPAVYDLAASKVFNAADIPAKAVFYLHGQHTGFVLRNTPEEVGEQSQTLGPVFDNNGLRRTWIVAGYSGLNDPVFEHLAAVRRFDYGLYWVGYRDQEPPDHVRSRLLSGDKAAFHVGGHDADSFFVTLAQRLEVFPPQFVGDPFNYLQGVLETLSPYTLPGEAVEKDVTLDARERIRAALETEAGGRAPAPESAAEDSGGEPGPLRSRILKEFMAGHNDRVIAITGSSDEVLPDEVADLVAWSYTLLGNGLLGQARAQAGGAADRLYAEAVDKYREAIRVGPDKHEVLYNWGNALSHWAKTKHGKEADRLYAEAVDRYREALRIKPDKHEALNNWGDALSHWAEAKDEEGADRLYAEAVEKYREANRVRPDQHEVLTNWSAALSDWAKRKEGPEADRLFREAVEKCREALRIIQDGHDALYNWGTTLSDWAKRKQGPEADRLYSEAAEKYREALRAKPDKHQALTNWGGALMDWARHKEGKEASRLYREAEDLFRLAEAIVPGEGAYNLGCLFALQQDVARAREWLERSRECGRLPPRSLLLDDEDLESVRATPWFHALLESVKE